MRGDKSERVGRNLARESEQKEESGAAERTRRRGDET
jgi:hypothetical protein